MRTALRAVVVMFTLVAFAPSIASAQMFPDASTLELFTRHAATTPTTKPADDNVADVGSFLELNEKRFTSMKVEDIWNLKFWWSYIQEAIAWAIGFVPRLLLAVFLVGLFWLIYRAVRKITLGGMKAAGVDDSIGDMLGHLLKWTILGFGLIIAGNQIGIQIAALLTGVSIIGLAVGFAAQDSISNFIAGIMIFWDKPFKVGDWIVIEGHLAQVKRVTFRSTRLDDMDGDIVIYPNTKMLSEKVVNKSANDVTRCNVYVGIAYKESIEKTRAVLLSMVAKDDRIEKKPEPEVVVKTLGPSSVDIALHFWIREERYEDAMQYEYTERAKLALDEAGIEIPFPHVQMLVENTPAMQSLATRSPRAA